MKNIKIITIISLLGFFFLSSLLIAKQKSSEYLEAKRLFGLSVSTIDINKKKKYRNK